MWKAEKKDNRIKVFYDDKFFIELDNMHDLNANEFLKSNMPILEDIKDGAYDEDTLELILENYKAEYNDKKYYVQQKTVFDYFW